jgi:hypothetical protein
MSDHDRLERALIHVLHDCWKYEVELRVQLSFVVGYGTTPNRVKVYKRSFMECQPPDRVVNPQDIHIQHMGPHLKWCLMRAGDPNPVRYGFETQADAERAHRNDAFSRNTPPKG